MDEVGEGIHRLGASYVSWYLIAEGRGVTLVDTGNPNQYGQLPAALSRLGRTIGDVEAIVLTHAHGDHLGSSARIQDESGAPVHVHRGDGALARGEAHREYERHFVRDLHRWYAWKALLFFLFGGATRAPPVRLPREVEDGTVLDVPGSPRVVHTPGHTVGSACLSLDDRGVVFTGDAMVTLSITTGRTGPMIMPGSFNRDSRQSLDSLDRLRTLPAELLLPGHGLPHSGPMADAVDQAVAFGAH